MLDSAWLDGDRQDDKRDDCGKLPRAGLKTE